MSAPASSELTTALRAALDGGPTADLDRLLGPSDPRADLRTVLGLAHPDRLRVLRDRLYDGDVVTHCYRRAAGRRVQGNVLFWLTGITSVPELLAREYPSADHLLAVCRTVRAWDDGTLTADAVFEVLEAALWDSAHDADPLDCSAHEPVGVR